MQVQAIIASRFRVDGGSMFGLVPYPIWSKLLTPDDRHRVAQQANCLLLRLDDERRVLVDTGCGNAARFTSKELAIHGLDTFCDLRTALAAAGVAPEEIDAVVLTHLHWDHAGGIVHRAGDEDELALPRARYIVHADEWRDATKRDPLLYKSYPAATIAPLRRYRRRLTLVSAQAAEIFPGVRLVRSGGHTHGHCTVVLKRPQILSPTPVECRRAVYAGDVCPTQHHLRLVFQTAYDTEPLTTRRWKLRWLPRLARANDLLLFDHDPELAGATLRVGPSGEIEVAAPVFPVT